MEEEKNTKYNKAKLKENLKIKIELYLYMKSFANSRITKPT